MKRRTLFTSVGMGILSQCLPLRNALAQGKSAAGSVFTEADYEPFKKIAAAKKVKIHFGEKTADAAKRPEGLNLDMDMVRASLALAIRDTRQKGALKLADKFDRLSKSGSPVQQVEFVIGTGTYYFPEDIQRAISAPEKVAEKVGLTCWVCHQVCSIVCGLNEMGDRVCEEKCRDVCHNDCS